MIFSLDATVRDKSQKSRKSRKSREFWMTGLMNGKKNRDCYYNNSITNTRTNTWTDPRANAYSSSSLSSKSTRLQQSRLSEDGRRKRNRNLRLVKNENLAYHESQIANHLCIRSKRESVNTTSNQLIRSNNYQCQLFFFIQTWSDLYCTWLKTHAASIK